MCGVKKCLYWPNWSHTLPKFFRFNGKWGIDQDILQHEIYPLALKHNDIIIHATFNKFEDFAQDFPVGYDDKYHFIGEYYSATEEGRNQEHIQMIKDALKQKQDEKQE